MRQSNDYFFSSFNFILFIAYAFIVNNFLHAQNPYAGQNDVMRSIGNSNSLAIQLVAEKQNLERRIRIKSDQVELKYSERIKASWRKYFAEKDSNDIPNLNLEITVDKNLDTLFIQAKWIDLEAREDVFLIPDQKIPKVDFDTNMNAFIDEALRYKPKLSMLNKRVINAKNALIKQKRKADSIKVIDEAALNERYSGVKFIHGYQLGLITVADIPASYRIGLTLSHLTMGVSLSPLFTSGSVLPTIDMGLGFGRSTFNIAFSNIMTSQAYGGKTHKVYNKSYTTFYEYDFARVYGWSFKVGTIAYIKSRELGFAGSQDLSLFPALAFAYTL